MNDRHRQKPQQKLDTIPFYNRKKQCWKVRIDGRIEFGSLLYVCSEFAKTGLYYPFSVGEPKVPNWVDHEHSFDGVLHSLINNFKTFSIAGYESYYSEQEIEMLEDVKNRLIEMEERKE